MPLVVELEVQATYWRLSLLGELDVSECSRFRLAVDRVLRYRPGLVIVDTRDLEYLDSSGLGILLSLSKQYSAGEGQLILVTGEPVGRLISAAGLSGVFATATSVRAALEARGLVEAVTVGPVQREAWITKGELYAAERTTQI